MKVVRFFIALGLVSSTLWAMDNMGLVNLEPEAAIYPTWATALAIASTFALVQWSVAALARRCERHQTAVRVLAVMIAGWATLVVLLNLQGNHIALPVSADWFRLTISVMLSLPVLVLSGRPRKLEPEYGDDDYAHAVG